MRTTTYIFILATLVFACKNDLQTGQTIYLQPPFEGTSSVSPNIITETDATSFESVTNMGQEQRTMYDLRVNNWITVNAYLFRVTFDDGLFTDIEVNPEFESTIASEQAEKYGIEIGRLPKTLRAGVTKIWIYKGGERFASVEKTMLVYSYQAELYEIRGLLEEVLMHEATHVTLDEEHATSQVWLSIQAADYKYISTYAQENPKTEDLAETVPLYLALKYRNDRLSDEIKQKILEAVPKRIAYLNSLDWDIYPWD